MQNRSYMPGQIKLSKEDPENFTVCFEQLNVVFHSSWLIRTRQQLTCDSHLDINFSHCLTTFWWKRSVLIVWFYGRISSLIIPLASNHMIKKNIFDMFSPMEYTLQCLHTVFRSFTYSTLFSLPVAILYKKRLLFITIKKRIISADLIFALS